MKSANLRAKVFFDREDEGEASTALREAFPNIGFIDGQRWPLEEPPCKDGIHLCRSNVVYLWPADAAPRLPVVPLPDAMKIDGARFQGPSSGPVIQVCRCIERDGLLEVGDISAHVSDRESKLGRALASIFGFLKSRYMRRMDCLGLTTGETPGARRLA